MKYLFHIASCILCMFFLQAGISLAQNTDQLEEKLKTATPQEKPALLNQIAQAYLKSNPEKCIDFSEQAIKAAKKVDDVDAETEAIITIGDAYAATKNVKKAVTYYKDVIKIFDQYNQPGSSAYIWNKISDAYFDTQKYNEALDANTKALDLFKKVNDRNGIVNTNIDLGDIHFKLKKYDSSLPYYKQALRMYEDSKDARGQITILNRIGTAYSEWGNYDEAYIFLSRALDMAKKSNLNSLAATIAQNIEVVKKNMSNWQKSQTEYAAQKEKELKEKEKEQEQQIVVKENQIKVKESQIYSLAEKNVKSLEEIEKLSFDAQIKELKIKTQQEEIIRKQLETDSQTKANDLLKKEKELQDSELNKQKLIIWGGIGFSLLGLIFTVYVFIAYRNKKKANDVLKQKNDIIYKQKEQIEQKNILITDSIDYAKNIQDAILPSDNILASYFPYSFIYYKPKDIVSGDFYWFHEEKGKCLCIAAADCTGHGVPGAFMSLLGFIMLDDIVKRNPNGTPADVLKIVNTELMDILHQDTQNTTGKFGMDVALMKYDIQSKGITFSGAHNPLIVISNGQMNEIKADKISIGTTTDCSFNNQTLQAKEGDMVYLYSDGYQDQIGGEKRKRFLAVHLKELLLQIHTLPPDQQKEEIDKKHMEWRGSTDQTDDILIIGIKI